MTVAEAIRLLQSHNPNEEILVAWWNLDWAKADNENATAETWAELVSCEESITARLGEIVEIENARFVGWKEAKND